jgi:hypothetical protein
MPYRRQRGYEICCETFLLHLSSTVKIVAIRFFETLITTHMTVGHHKLEDNIPRPHMMKSLIMYLFPSCFYIFTLTFKYCPEHFISAFIFFPYDEILLFITIKQDVNISVNWYMIGEHPVSIIISIRLAGN